MKISSGCRVKIEYRITSDEDELLDCSDQGGPLQFEHGAGNVFSAIEDGLFGAEVGEKRVLRLTPEQGYGPVYDELVQWVPLDVFEDTESIEVGMRFEAALENGQVRKVDVKEKTESAILVDGNHPFAGLFLNFEVRVLDVMC